uniref:Integrase core domain containing protein n=1 Tax=Solanum tuberosum TaxID=4113 RepID=M1DF62_SOLTU
FPQRIIKKNEEGKYHRFIAMLKQFSINVLLIEALEQMPGYAKFMKALVMKKRAMSFEDDDRLQHCSDYDELVAALDGFEFCSNPRRLELDMKNRDSPPARPSIK